MTSHMETMLMLVGVVKTPDLNILAPMTVVVTSVLWQPVPNSRLTFILQSLIDRINFCIMF